MMHLRVSKALHAEFDYDHAHDVAAADWAGDITNFSGDAAENIWLEEVKKKLRRAADIYGWKALFEHMDEDGNGELDKLEFLHAVRFFEIDEEQLSDEAVDEVFEIVDIDGGGTIDVRELMSVLATDKVDASLKSALTKSAVDWGWKKNRRNGRVKPDKLNMNYTN